MSTNTNAPRMKWLLLNFLVTIVAVLAAFMIHEWYQRHTREKYIDAAYLTQAFAVIGTVKPRVTEFHDRNGRWPSSNAEAGLQESATFANQSITGLAISSGGVITVSFKQRLGESNGTLRITPTINASGMTDWACTTSTFQDIQKWVPQCTYVPAG